MRTPTKLIVWSLAILLWVPSAYAVEPDYGLLNQGKADDLKKQLYAHFQSSTGEARIAALNDLLELTMLTQDPKGMAYAFDKHWPELVQQYENVKKDTEEGRQLSSGLFDSYHTKFVYRNIIVEDAKNLRVALQHYKSPPYAPTYPHSGYDAAMGARAAAMLDQRDLARKLQRRARGLILQRNLNIPTTQAALADLLETSLYQLHDVEDVRRFIRAIDIAAAKKNSSLNISMNPYVHLRLIRTAYDAGVLSGDEEIAAIELLHKYYQKLQITAESTMDNNRVAFYGYLALEEALGSKRQISFNPALYLYERDDQVFVGVGVRAYLEASGLAPTGAKAGESLSTLLAWFESRESQVGDSIKRTNLPTYLILKSLDERLRGNTEGEARILEQFADAQMKYFRSAGYSMLDQPPALSRPSLIVNEYALRRSREIAQDSETMSDFFFFNILSINAAKNSNRQISYSLIKEAANEIELDQIVNFVVLNDRYNRATSEVYTNALISMAEVRGKTTLEGWTAVQTFQPIEELFSITGKQLGRLGQLPNNLTLWNTAQLGELNPSATQIVIAETNDTIFVMVVKKGASPVTRILRRPKDGNIEQSLKLLSSKDISKVESEKIREASAIVSKFLFGGSLELTGEVQFISGPLLAGIPYTLLSDPVTEKWIMQVATPRAFDSFAHAQMGKEKREGAKSLRYVAFANPSLQSFQDREQLAQVESMIRGGRLGDLSELPETELEVKEFSSLFDLSQTKLFFREAANIDNFFSIDYSNVETLSLNTHGVVAGEIENATSPSIVLAATKNSAGIVSSEWIFSTRGAPRVAILSTCNSGTQSQNFDYSEQNSLSGAFLLKGSDAVISSYWQVNSLGATALMKGLAKRVAKGSEYGEALTGAARDLIDSSSNYSHPSVWAAFVVVGRYQVKPEFMYSESRLKKIASIDGPVFDVALGDQKLIGVFNVQKNRGELLEFSATTNSPIRKVLETEEDEFLKVSLNTERGLYFAIRKKAGTDYFRYLGSGRREKLCMLEDTQGFHLRNFHVDESAIFSLYSYRDRGGGLTVVLTSQELTSCKSQILGTHKFDKKSFPGPSVTANLYPGPSADTALLVFNVPKVDAVGKPITYRARDSQFGFQVSCEVMNGIEAYLISKSGKITGPIISGGMHFYDSSEARTVGLLATEDGQCGFSNSARLVGLTWFVGDDPYIGRYLLDKSPPSKFNVEEELIGQQFGVVTKWWALKDGDLVYVLGTPGLQNGLFPHFRDGQLAPTTTDFLISSDYGIYVYSKTGKNWRKLISQEGCHLPRPLIFSGKPTLSCLIPSNKTTYSESVIYEYQ